MKTKLMIIATMVLMMMAPQNLSAQFGQTAPELNQIVRTISYPSAWSEWNIEGDVTVAFEISATGEIIAMDAWGHDQMLAQYVKRHVSRSMRRAGPVTADAGVQAFHVSFRMDSPEAVPVVSASKQRFDLEQVLRDELFSLETGVAVGKASVVVKTNGFGMIEDVRIWGENPVMVSRLQRRLSGLNGRILGQTGQEQIFRYDLVLK